MRIAISTMILSAMLSATCRAQLSPTAGSTLSPIGITRTPGSGSAKPPARATGSVVYPGTPGEAGVGRILSPGNPGGYALPDPVRPTTPTDVTPTPFPNRLDRMRPRHQPDEPYRHYGPRVYVPVFVPVYGYAGYGNVVEVQRGSSSVSRSEHVITVGREEPVQQPVARPKTEGEAPYVLIALTGGLIYAAERYEVDERALRFVTVQGDEYVVPMAEVDLEFTKRLNAERGVDFELPG